MSKTSIRNGARGRLEPNSGFSFKFSPEDIAGFLQLAINKLEDHFYLVDIKGHILYANDTACNALGYSRPELLAMKVSDFDPNYPETAWNGFIEQVRQTGTLKLETVHVTKQGKTLPVAITGIYMKFRDREYVIALGTDITEKIKVKQSLAEAVTMYRLLADNMRDSVFVLDADLKPVYMSPSARKERGYTLEEFCELPAEKVRSADSEKRYREMISEMIRTSKDCPTDQSITWSLETECYRKDGRSYWCDNQYTLLRGENGKISGLLVVARDITERKLIEERVGELNKELGRRILELEASNKELESFAYSVSHEMIAPLRSIKGFSQAVLEDYGDKVDEQCKNYMTRIRSAGQRLSQQIEDMLTLSRITSAQAEVEKVDLSSIAKRFATELKRSHPQRHVNFIIEDGLIIDGDRNLLEKVMQNLLRNSWKFSGKHDRARIEVGSKLVDGERVYFVKDDGAGFDMRYAERLFLPFQRMHSTAEFPGNGIGLATVQRIIKRHGGRLWAESAVDKGTTVCFTIKLDAGDDGRST
jgi:PAS domain S-box-containing protein